MRLRGTEQRRNKFNERKVIEKEMLKARELSAQIAVCVMERSLRHTLSNVDHQHTKHQTIGFNARCILHLCVPSCFLALLLYK